METPTPALAFFFSLAKIDAVMSRRFDGALGGLGFTEFAILFQLSRARDERMRRIDLAEAVGLTASGVTRLLAPMEKIGLVKRQANADDARVSLVALAAGGRRKLAEAMEDAEDLAQDALRFLEAKRIKELAAVLGHLAGNRPGPSDVRT